MVQLLIIGEKQADNPLYKYNNINFAIFFSNIFLQ